MVRILPAMQDTWVQSLGCKGLGEGNGYPFHYSCLEDSKDRGAWHITVYGMAESDATEQLSLSLFFNHLLNKRQRLILDPPPPVYQLTPIKRREKELL